MNLGERLLEVNRKDVYDQIGNRIHGWSIIYDVWDGMDERFPALRRDIIMASLDLNQEEFNELQH